MRVVVLGGTGLIGNRLVRQLSDASDVFASTRTSKDQIPFLDQILSKEQWIFDFDATSEEKLRIVLSDLRPNVVVNCLGVTKHQITSTDFEKAIILNSILPHRLSDLASEYNFKLIHLSTDCVFSGNSGNYVESSIPDPTDFYGRSKVLGELNNSRDLTIRTSFVGNEIKSFTNFFEWIQRNKNRDVIGYSNAIYSGVTTEVLSEVIQKLIFNFSALTGLWHFSSEPISKYKLIRDLNDVLNLGIKLSLDRDFVCDRSLNSSALFKMTGIEAPSWAKMLERYVDDHDWYESIRGNRAAIK